MEPTSENVFAYLNRIGFSVVDSKSRRIYSLDEWSGDLRHTPIHAETVQQVIYVQPNWGNALNGFYLFSPNRRTVSSHVGVRAIGDGFDLTFKRPVFDRNLMSHIQNYSEIYLTTKGVQREMTR